MEPKVGDQTQYVGLDYAIVSSLISIKHMIKQQDPFLISGKLIHLQSSTHTHTYIYNVHVPSGEMSLQNNPTKECYCAERMSAGYNRLPNEAVWQTFSQAII